MVKKFSKEALANRVLGSGTGIGSEPPEDRFTRASRLLATQPTGFESSAAVPAATPPALEVSKPATFTRESTDGGRSVYYVEAAPIEQIDPNPFNARRIYVPERVNEMSRSIQATGQLMPGLATVRNGRYVLAAGHYRWKGITTAKLPTMKLMVHEGLTDQELYEISFKENDERNEQSPLDNAMAWRALLDDNIYPNESAIAEGIGISLPNVNKTLAILKLSDEVLDLVRLTPEKFALTALYELVQLEKTEVGREQSVEMAKKIAEGEAGRKEVAELRAMLESPAKERKPKENSRQYKIQIEGAEAGSIKEWDSGRLALDVVIKDPAERSAILHELKKRFHIND